jgi:hypothetical protein
MSNDEARTILEHARRHLVRWELGDLYEGDTQAIQLLFKNEMGLAYDGALLRLQIH